MKKPQDEANIDVTPVVAQAPEPAGSSAQAHIGKRLWQQRRVQIAALVVLVAAAGGTAWWQFRPHPSPNGQSARSLLTTTPTPSPSPSPTPVPYGGVLSAATRAAQLQTFTHPTTGETWLDTRRDVAKQDWIKYEPGDGPVTKYYQVGSRNGATIFASETRMMSTDVEYFEKTAEGKVTLIANPNAFAHQRPAAEVQYLNPTVPVNYTQHYDSLSVPAELVFDGGYILTAPDYAGTGEPEAEILASNQAISFTTVKTFGQSRLELASLTNVDTRLTSILYFMRTPAHNRIRLDFTPTELDVRDYTWTSGQQTSEYDTFSPLTHGCGAFASGGTIDTNLVDSALYAAGTSKSGHKLYQLKDTASTLFQKAYQEYKDQATGGPNPVMNTDQYQAAHGLVFHKDAFGRWLVYARDSIRMQGGCAKPVVYLYPTQFEPVHVRVGANVTKSEPLYDSLRGWDTWASPTGTVWVNGQAYDSLYWEGTGLGTYPAVQAGTVAARNEAATTIRRQLAQQGLRGREIDDFMTYWEPKLPNTPFVRLTWFGNTQLERLAPLAVSPRPETVIRVFLDFEGLQQFEELPPQHFTAPERRGFTVVEWGGLTDLKLLQ